MHGSAQLKALIPYFFSLILQPETKILPYETDKTQSSELLYNNSINEIVLDRQETIDSLKLHLITYSRPHDVCKGREVHLGNQAGGFPFRCLGHNWKGVEFLYLLGEWSINIPYIYA